MESAMLEFPEIAAPAEPRTEVATAAAAALDLERLDLTKIALAGFGDWRGALASTTANLGSLALDLTTAAKCKEARTLRQRLIGTPVAEARKTATAIKSKMASTSKAVGAELEAIEAAYEGCDILILPKIEAREAELEAERQEKARLEAERVAKHQQGIATIRAYLAHCQQPGMTAERIAKGIEALQAQAYGAEWEEFQVPAANAQCETLEAMRVLHAQVLGREQEAARQEAIRAENERQAEMNRIEAKRIADEAAEIRRQAAELAAQRAESERLERQAEERRQQLAKVTEEPAPQQVLKAEPATADATDRGTPDIASPHGGAMGAGQAAAAAPAGGPVPVTAAGFASLERWTDEDPDAATKLPRVDLQEEPRRSISIMLDMTEAPIQPQPEPATITLGQIKEWAGMPAGLTREFIEARGIKPTVDGRALLFTESQRRELKIALVLWATGLQA